MMEKCNYRKDPHQDIDHVFRDLLPAHGMVERPAQVELSHQMLDTMLNGTMTTLRNRSSSCWTQLTATPWGYLPPTRPYPLCVNG